MQRLPRAPLRYDGFALFASYAAAQKVSIRSPGAAEDFAAQLAQEAQAAASNEMFLHGHRVEAIFERVVAGIGACRLLKKEDAGEVYHSLGGEIRVPDFRILLPDGRQVLVEVKSLSSGTNPRRNQRLHVRYADALARYADAMGCELLFATYWASWKQWTLVPRSAFVLDGARLTLSLPEAMVASRFADLGDMVIGTPFPLRVRVVADPALSSSIDEGGLASFTAHHREVYCQSRRIEDPQVQRLALALAWFGTWEMTGPGAICDGHGRVEAVEWRFIPRDATEEDSGDGCALIGSLSGIGTSMHRLATQDDEGGVVGVLARFEPGGLGALIPDDYGSKELPLARITVEPPDPEPA